ncbi:hypothetical protein E3N88_33195 [Mikania micrantha]|uniref:Uncharacterized protein n=1 Tax=Mikania micrantha TaxID=192012 RepID=A0A5N6MAK0_9ASTR|nr:hypothetical protein E3N88_33195 [Mikania micrantha]
MSYHDRRCMDVVPEGKRTRILASARKELEALLRTAKGSLLALAKEVDSSALNKTNHLQASTVCPLEAIAAKLEAMESLKTDTAALKRQIGTIDKALFGGGRVDEVDSGFSKTVP